MVIKQVQHQDRTSVHNSGSGPVMVTRVRQFPVTTKQVHGDTSGTRSSQKVSLHQQGPWSGKDISRLKTSTSTIDLRQEQKHKAGLKLTLGCVGEVGGGSVVKAPDEASQGH